MTLLHPLLLAAGLAAIAIPIAIHFFMRRRRQPIAWGAMRFLLEAYQQQRRRLEFEKWLLLALRCLVLALLALGLARPLLGGAGLGGDTPRELYILLDNSLAAAAVSDDGTPALDRHKEAARAALADLDPGRGDRAALITLAAPADPVISPPSAEPDAVADLIDTLEPTDARADFAGALARVAELTAEPRNADRVVLVLSDWREGTFDEARSLPRLDQNVRLVSLPAAAAPIDNQQITSVRPLRAVVLAGDAGSTDTAASAQQVRVEMRRLGPSLPASTGTLGLRLDRVRTDGKLDEARSVRTTTEFTWDPGQAERTIVAPLPAIDDPSPGLGVLTAELRAQPGLDAITRDNVVRRVVDVRRNLRVGVIARARFGRRAGVESFTPADWLAAVLDPDPATFGTSTSPVEPVQIEPAAVDAPRLAGLDAAFVLEPGSLDQRAWDNLARFSARGGLVVLAPDAEPSAARWTDTAVAAFDLPIAFAPEPIEHDPPLAVTVPTESDLGPLSLLAAELADLTGPVRAFRTLTARPEPGAPASSIRPLLTLSSGEPFVWTAEPDTPGTTTPGLVAVFASAIDPDWTDLPARPLFVPLVQELIRQGVGEARGAASVPAGATIPASAGHAELVAVAGPRRFRIDPTGVSAEPVRTAGAFAALGDDGALRTLAIVNPDTRAGRPDPTPEAALEQHLRLTGVVPSIVDTTGDAALAQRVTRAVRPADSTGAPISWITLLAALVFALVECVLARRASHADTAKTTNAAASKSAARIPHGAAA